MKWWKEGHHGDITLDILKLIVVLALAYWYFVGMLLIISFVTLSILQFTMPLIWALAGVFTGIMAVVCVVRLILKYRKLAEKEAKELG